MRRPLLALVAVALAPLPAYAVKTVKYPEIKVEVAKAYTAEPALETMRKALAEAVTKKDSAALFGMVGPTFLWSVQSATSDHFDYGRDAQQNFRVAFGFREFGKDADGPVQDGPYWETLAEILKATALDQAAENVDLVCTPPSVGVVDATAFEKARKAIETEDDPADWFYTTGETAVVKAPGDAGPPLAKVGRIALPVLDVHPTAPEGQPAPAVTHYQVLLPSGKTGWVPEAGLRPLVSDRLCFAKATGGEWKIVSFDQNQ